MTTPDEKTFATLTKLFEEEFGPIGDRQVLYVHAPGRSEISGNHTDHEGGHVIAGSLDVAVDGIAVATDSNKVRVADVGGVMPDADAHAEGTLGLGVFGFLDVRAGDGIAAAVQDLNQRIGAGAAAADEMDRADAFEQLGVIHTKNHNSGHLKIYPLP